MVIRISHTGQKYAIMWERYRPGGRSVKKKKMRSVRLAAAGSLLGLTALIYGLAKYCPGAMFPWYQNVSWRALRCWGHLTDWLPFSLLEWSVVHNGEISSYDANRRFIEMYGYNCSLLTDTEVITYIIDFLVRRKGLTLEEAAGVIAAPFWSTIEQMPEAQRERLAYLRETFASLLITGPFSILLGFTGGMMALNDRLKLRSMVCAEKGEAVYFASEECAIRVMEPDVETLWAPRGGQAVVVRLNDGVTV